MATKPKKDEAQEELDLVEVVETTEVILDGANAPGVFAPSLQGTSWDPSRPKE